MSKMTKPILNLHFDGVLSESQRARIFEVSQAAAESVGCQAIVTDAGMQLAVVNDKTQELIDLMAENNDIQRQILSRMIASSIPGPRQ